MTRREAYRLSNTIEQAGMVGVRVRCRTRHTAVRRNLVTYDITAIDPQTGDQCVITSPEAWTERVAEAALYEAAYGA